MENLFSENVVTEEEVYDAMRNTFLRLMSLKSGDGVQWSAPVSDLVELSHQMWYDGFARDSLGRRIPFKYVVAHLCGVLSVKCPQNPSAVMTNVRRRKDLDLKTRFRKMMESGCEDPLSRFVSVKRVQSSLTDRRLPNPGMLCREQ